MLERNGHGQTVGNGRDKLGRFLPGNQGGGRPAEYREFRERAREFMDREGLTLLVELARRPNTDQAFALKLLAEYGFGKPQAHVDVTTGGVGMYEQGGEIKAYGSSLDLDRV